VSLVDVGFGVIVIVGNYTGDETGCNVAESDATDHGEHRETETPIDAPAEDEARGGGDRKSGQRLVPNVIADRAMRRRVMV